VDRHANPQHQCIRKQPCEASIQSARSCGHRSPLCRPSHTPPMHDLPLSSGYVITARRHEQRRDAGPRHHPQRTCVQSHDLISCSRQRDGQCLAHHNLCHFKARSSQTAELSQLRIFSPRPPSTKHNYRDIQRAAILLPQIQRDCPIIINYQLG
jgi:hypothetical protein